MASSSPLRGVLRRVAGMAPAVLPERTVAALLAIGSRVTPTTPTAGLPAIDRLLVVAPHPDDETIMAGGTIARVAAAGGTVTVLTVTDGEASLAGLARDEIARRRREESARAGGVLGVSTVRPLGLPDGSVGEHAAQLVATLADAIDELRPDVVVVPWFGDAHADHVAVASAVTTATARATHAPREIWGGEAHTPGPATRVVDITDVIDVKRAALACHETAARASDLDATLGLNRFRSVLTQRGRGWAECFVAGDPATWAGWVEAAGADRPGGPS